jgi:hypothetical protein
MGATYYILNYTKKQAQCSNSKRGEWCWQCVIRYFNWSNDDKMVAISSDGTTLFYNGKNHKEYYENHIYHKKKYCYKLTSWIINILSSLFTETDNYIEDDDDNKLSEENDKLLNNIITVISNKTGLNLDDAIKAVEYSIDKKQDECTHDLLNKSNSDVYINYQTCKKCCTKYKENCLEINKYLYNHTKSEKINVENIIIKLDNDNCKEILKDLNWDLTDKIYLYNKYEIFDYVNKLKDNTDASLGNNSSNYPDASLGNNIINGSRNLFLHKRFSWIYNILTLYTSTKNKTFLIEIANLIKDRLNINYPPDISNMKFTLII